MPDRILAAHDVYPSGSGAERVHRTYWHRANPLQPLELPDDVASKSHAVHVTVNDGRWIVVCPDCQEGQVAAKDDRRFVCFVCRNVAVEGRWRPVIWPNDVDAIESELLKRPRKERVKLSNGRYITRGPRNWMPGESVEDLQREALDQTRASVPRLEDLDERTARQLVAVHDVAAQGDVSAPVVRWDNDERTLAVVEWKREHRKTLSSVD